jgi:hypothetical protein
LKPAKELHNAGWGLAFYAFPAAIIAILMRAARWGMKPENVRLRMPMVSTRWTPEPFKTLNWGLGSMDKRPQDLYQEGEKRVNDAIQLKEPDRVPVMCLFGFFPARYTGITFEDAMYDYDKMMKAWVETTVAFQPDMYENPFNHRFLGAVMDTLGFKQLKWPGHGAPVMSTYQYVEDEYMKADEYDLFFFDLTDFMVRTYWPRIFGALQPFSKLPPLHKGLDGFMSSDQFKTFYWPTLRKLMIGLIDEGLNPFVFWEGDCTSRLEAIGDIPRGKVVYSGRYCLYQRQRAALHPVYRYV